MSEKMNPRIKDLWIDALQSGHYEQGTGKLRNKWDEFCCLGVLCNIHAQENPEVASKETDPRSYMGLKNYPSRDVLIWSELPFPSIDDLIIMNDIKQMGFPEIAAYISANL
jgi:hypothetical protein